MCKVRKIHLLAINGCLWFAIGARIATIGLINFLAMPKEQLWWMLSLSFLVFAGFFMISLGISLKYIPGIPDSFFAWFHLGLGLGLLSAGIRFLIRWFILK